MALPDAFVAKPIDPDEILRLVRKLLARRLESPARHGSFLCYLRPKR
jgi:DNA-binding NarL/FixJ family response regulator